MQQSGNLVLFTAVVQTATKMRYRDWDVLIFPYGGSNSLVPLHEFRTNCFALQNQSAGTVTPLVTCFVPSLAHNASFHLSVHSWTEQSIFGATNPYVPADANYMWQVHVIVDGISVATQTYPHDISWPQQIAMSNTLGKDGKSLPLGFPPFHGSFLAQTHWDASEDMGRIKVELSAGHMVEQHGTAHFMKVVTHALFAFQPAPLGLLERNGVAWPSHAMPVIAVNHPTALQTTMSPIRPTYHFPNTFTNKRHLSSASVFDTNSRSTSGYTDVPISVYRPMVSTIPSSAQSVTFSDDIKQRTEIRLSSDQLNKLIAAMSSPSNPAAAANSMPPPPTPLNVDQKTKGPDEPQSDSTTASTTLAPGRREDSQYSDVSMHVGCASFPSCTTEDAEGHIVHAPETPLNSAFLVKGKKEGSSPTKQRDFMSTVLDPAIPLLPSRSILLSSSPVDNTEKKRTRSALKSLSINDGSPEKLDRCIKPQCKISRIDSLSSDKEHAAMET
ncbi:Hypothetical protein R9X50_00614800 [Acrodontium crateriforme]|uniref:Uncharacterized protein n=1 Tax=Acrodontium crateriforme TaxID=150365 RepID=A0AAQ3RBF6_9PEZI|nr:Hypothetical protein R9X50_00614800 [Acrodontium crateriforme]